jgi:putative PIN family toxin of toxin-antitoxin system
MLRVVIDTNVLIEGAKDPHSYQVRIMRLALAGELLPLISPRTISEHDRLIDRLVVEDEYRTLLENFLDQAEEIEPGAATEREAAGTSSDREDDKFLSLAKDGDADYIITRDKDLLELEQYGETEITTPERFWNTYQEVAGSTVRALGY